MDGRLQNRAYRQSENIEPKKTAEYSRFNPRHGEVGVGRYSAFFVWCVCIAVAVFVLQVLLEREVLRICGKRTMPEDRAVDNRLNGYQCFRPSADEYAELAAGLCLEFRRGVLAQKTLSGSKLDCLIGNKNCPTCEREQDERPEIV